MIIPASELSLFRHDLHSHVFYASVQVALEWGTRAGGGVINEFGSSVLDFVLERYIR